MASTPDDISDLGTVDCPGERIVSDLLQNCQVLAAELELFQQYLVTQRQDVNVELRHYKSSVKTELKSLERVRSQILTFIQFFSFDLRN